jgi:hypothetical protein
LSTYVGLAAVREVRDTQRAVWIVRRRHIRPSLPIGNRGLPSR